MQSLIEIGFQTFPIKRCSTVILKRPPKGLRPAAEPQLLSIGAQLDPKRRVHAERQHGERQLAVGGRAAAEGTRTVPDGD